MISRKPVGKSQDASIQLLEVSSSSFRDTASRGSRSGSQTREQNDYGGNLKPDASYSATSTMMLRPSASSWNEDADLRDPEAAAPRWALATKRVRLFWWTFRYFVIFATVFIGLLIPMLIFSNDADVEDDATLEDIEAKQYQNLVFFLCLWLEISWVGFVFFDIVGLSLPYFVRFVTRYVNAAHNRYWRVFKLLRHPICFLFGIIVCFVAFVIFINFNGILAVNIVGKDPNSEYLAWDDIIADVLQRLTLWAVFYFLEKIFIAYIAVHYHYRQSDKTLIRGKEIHNAISVLYQASLSLFPDNDSTFTEEDRLIRNATGKANASARIRLSSYLARLHMDTYKVASAFGNFVSDSPDAHWMRPTSAYAIIDRSWSDETAATALATRIWKSLVSSDKTGLTKKDVADVLGLGRADMADSVFKTIDENETGEIPLRDFVGLVKETGATRRKIYRGIVDMDHCVNTFDWLCLIIIAFVMAFFIVVRYVPAIKEIQTILSSLAIGISFAVGRTFNHLLTGIIFTFFDHPFDTGDVVHVSNTGLPLGPVFTVTRQSLLYTVFRRLDNGTDVQISNDQLAMRNIENYSRSGINRQGLSIFLDIRTSFNDLAKLRTLLQEFLAENSSDYVPTTLGFSVASLHELNKMELKLAFTHRNNWSDDKLRAQRSNRFMCALVAACRAIPINQPGAMLPKAGENGNPFYYAQLSDTMALSENIQKEKDRRAGLRWDFEKKDDEKKTDEKEKLDMDGAQGEQVPQEEVQLSPEEKKKIEEKEAMQKLSVVNAGKPKASSTGADTGKPTFGLRGRGPR